MSWVERFFICELIYQERFCYHPSVWFSKVLWLNRDFTEFPLFLVPRKANMRWNTMLKRGSCTSTGVTVLLCILRHTALCNWRNVPADQMQSYIYLLKVCLPLTLLCWYPCTHYINLLLFEPQSSDDLYSYCTFQSTIWLTLGCNLVSTLKDIKLQKVFAMDPATLLVHISTINASLQCQLCQKQVDELTYRSSLCWRFKAKEKMVEMSFK